MRDVARGAMLGGTLALWLQFISSCPAAGEPPARDAASSSTPAAAAPEFSTSQRRQARKLVSTFRQARRSPQRRSESAQTLLSWGPVGAGLLLEVVEDELRPKLDRYRQAFMSAAATGIARNAANPAEILALRAQIRQVSQLPDLTEQIIRERSEPALNRLSQLLLIDRRKVLEGSSPLVTQRNEMAELGRYWELCQNVLATAVAPPPAAGPAEAPLAQASFESYLAGEEELAIQSAMPVTDRDRAVLTNNLRSVGALDREEARGILALNLLRVMVGLNALEIDLALCRAARDHSQDMRTQQFFSHTSPVPGKTSFVDRAALFGAKASAENIAQGPVEGLASLKMWYFSPGHHKNVLGEAQRIGLGRSGTYWTQVFGR